MVWLAADGILHYSDGVHRKGVGWEREAFAIPTRLGRPRKDCGSSMTRFAHELPTSSLAAYDPHYDPLVSDGPGQNQDYAPTY